MDNQIAATEYGKLMPRDDGLKVVTIILGKETPQMRKDFHCLGCGRIVFNYYTDVAIIIVGEMRDVSRPQDIMCSRCKLIHRVS
jgi:hypothetical protein